MDLAALAFYVMAAVTAVCGFMVVIVRNPVHAVLFLIATFFSAAGLFVLLGAEFLAMLLVVVYVGAVAVLFLFVVMMLDVDFDSLRKGFVTYMPVGGLIGIALLTELILIGLNVVTKGKAAGAKVEAAHVQNIIQIADVLYTQYVYVFIGSGFVLLLAMVGAIVLTLRHRTHVKRQDIFRQTTRRRKESMAIVSVVTGEGITLTETKSGKETK